MQPVIAFITNYFPSTTFINKEVVGLRKRNVSIIMYSANKPHTNDHVDKSQDLIDSTRYLLPLDIRKLVIAHVLFMFSCPWRYFHILFFVLTRKIHKQNNTIFQNQSRFHNDRIRTFLHFCEGVLFAKLLLEEAAICHIHAHYASHPTTLAMVASALTGIPFSFTAHAYDIWFDRLFVEEKVNDAKFVLTCTQYGKSRILETNRVKEPGKIATIYHGVDVAKFIPKKDSNRHNPVRLLNVASLVPEKAQENLVKACGILKEEGIELECHIVGGGPLDKPLRSLITQYGLDDNVFLKGYVPHHDLVSVYHAADIFVLPSVSENLPNALLESLSCGIPAIASCVGGIPEVIKHGETGVLVSPGNVEALADAIKTLISDPDLCSRLAENGKAFIRGHLDQELLLDRMVYHYKSFGLV